MYYHGNQCAAIASTISAGGPQVTLLTGCNWTGSKSMLGSGSYDTAQMGIPDKALRSIAIPPGFKVTLYDAAGFTGNSKVLTDSVNCLRDVGFGAVTSSLKIEPGESLGTMLPPKPGTRSSAWVKGI